MACVRDQFGGQGRRTRPERQLVEVAGGTLVGRGELDAGDAEFDVGLDHDRERVIGNVGVLAVERRQHFEEFVMTERADKPAFSDRGGTESLIDPTANMTKTRYEVDLLDREPITEASSRVVPTCTPIEGDNRRS